MIHLTLDYQSDQNCRTPGEYLRYHRIFQGKSTREVAESVGMNRERALRTYINEIKPYYDYILIDCITR